MTDSDLLRMISVARYQHPSDIARRVGARSVNAQLGRLNRMGMLDRVPGPKCYLYRSRQAALL